MAEVLQRVLSTPSTTVPLHLSSFRVDVDYLPGQWPEEARRETLDEAFEELQDALRLGFFDWTGAADRADPRVTTDWSQQEKLSITVEAAGMHCNAIVVLLRLIVRLHHMSQGDFDELMALLGDEALGLPARTVFDDTVSALRVTELVRSGDASDVDADLLAFVGDGVRKPPMSALQGDGNELVDAPRILVTANDENAFDADAFDDIEDCFLRLMNSGAFASLAELDCRYADNEPEMFLRARDDGALELVVDDYDQQLQGLLELLNVMAGGRIEALSVTVDEPDR